MREEQRLFLVQAKSAYSVFKLLRADPTVHHCHSLHYLQMSTELLGKAYAWRNGPTQKSHKSLVDFFHAISSNKTAQKKLGFEGKNQNWSQTIRKLKIMAERIENLAPSLAKDGANPEYPWPPDSPQLAPVEFEFPIWKELTEESHGRASMRIIAILIDSAEEYM